MKLSDSKFIGRSVERSKVQAAPRLEADDLSRLRGIADKQQRTAKELLSTADADYEPVSFQHPIDGRRVYGWLVAVDNGGNARVEIGDGEYAVVPPSELKRIGSKENRDEVRQQLRDAIGHVAVSSEGVRVDLHETQSLMPLSAEQNPDYLLSLSYAASYGPPTDDEVHAYVSEFHPTASIIDVDDSMPGRMGVALRVNAEEEEKVLRRTVEPKPGFRDSKYGPSYAKSTMRSYNPEEEDELRTQLRQRKKRLKDVPEREKERKHKHIAEDKDAEMGAAAGGEVLEVLDPGEDCKPCDKKAELPKVAWNPLKPGGWFRPNAPPTVDFPSAAKAISESGNKELMADVLQSFFTQGGAKSIANAGAGQFSRMQLLEAAMPVVKRSNPKLWKTVADLTSQAVPTVKTQSPAQAAKPGDEKVPGLQGNNAPPAGQQGQPGGETLENNPEPDATPQGAPQQPGQQQETAQQPAQQPVAQGQTDLDVNQLNAERAELMRLQNDPNRPADWQQRVDKYEQDADAYNQKLQQQTPGQQASMKTGSKRSAAFERSAASERPEHYGLPADMHRVHRGMKMHRMARRGDYVVARVEFDPKLCKELDAVAVKNQVISFVKAQAASGEGRAAFGGIGKVHVMSCDAKKGVAQVRFATLLAGATPLETVVGEKD